MRPLRELLPFAHHDQNSSITVLMPRAEIRLEMPRAEIRLELRDCILAHWAACCRSHMSPGARARHSHRRLRTVNLDCDRLQARRWRPRASSLSRAGWTRARPCSRRCRRAPRTPRRVRTATTRAPFHISCRPFQSDGHCSQMAISVGWPFQSDGPARVSGPEPLGSRQAFRTRRTAHVELACLLSCCHQIGQLVCHGKSGRR